MTLPGDWDDLEAPRAPRGSPVPMITIGTPRRELAYLNAAARRLLGNPRHVRWQSNGGRIGIIRADFIGEHNGGRRYSIDRNGYVTCTPVLSKVRQTPVTFRLALDGERLTVVAKVEKR